MKPTAHARSGSHRGAYASVQDIGRRGHRRIGVPWAGVLDARLMRIANALVGNAEGTPVIECFDGGLHLVARGGTLRLAVAGDARAEIERAGESQVLDAWRSLTLADGDALRVRRLERGRIAVVAVEGLVLPQVLGSASTYARARARWRGRPCARCRHEAARAARPASAPNACWRSRPPARAGRSASSPGRRPSTSTRPRWPPSATAITASAPRPTAWACGWKVPTLVHQGAQRDRVRRHRAGVDPGAGQRPADRAAGRRADGRRLSEDRHRHRRRPAPRGRRAARAVAALCLGERGRRRAAGARGRSRDPRADRQRAAAAQSAASTKRRCTPTTWSAACWMRCRSEHRPLLDTGARRMPA